MNLNDRNPYDKNEAYCTECKKYFNPNSNACSDHFLYNEYLNLEHSGCYITTAICEILEFDDDNIYLNTLRNFRDNYMIKDENLKKILIQYDIIGPMISYNLENDNHKRTKSLMLLELYIKPIVNHINNQQYVDAIIMYEKMTNELLNGYNIKQNEINDDVDTTNIGKGHKIKIKEI
jgi:hypothetical protein